MEGLATFAKTDLTVINSATSIWRYDVAESGSHHHAHSIDLS